jgi:hypothetical protein
VGKAEAVAPAARALVTKTYDIRDLLAPIPDFKPPSVWAVAEKAAPGEGPGKKQDPAGPAQALMEKLIDSIRAAVDPTSWAAKDGPGETAIRGRAGTLFVTQTAENQAAVAEFIRRLREPRSLQTSIEARFIWVPGAQETKLREWMAKELKHPLDEKTGQALLNDDEVKALTEHCDALAGARKLFAPKLTLMNGQRASVTVAEMKPVSLKKTGQPNETLPTTFQEGVILDIKSTVAPDRKGMTLALRPSVSQLLSKDAEPLFSLASADVQRDVAEGETLLVRLPVVEMKAVGVSEVKNPGDDEATVQVTTVPADKPRDPGACVYVLARGQVVKVEEREEPAAGRVLKVAINLPGASVRAVDAELEPIFMKAAAMLPDVEAAMSVSRSWRFEGFVRVKAEADAEALRSQLAKALDAATLPANAGKPAVTRLAAGEDIPAVTPKEVDAVDVEIDRVRSATLYVNPEQIQEALAGAMDAKPDELATLPVRTVDGHTVQLRDVATLKHVKGVNSIAQRIDFVAARPAGAFADSLAGRFAVALERQELPALDAARIDAIRRDVAAFVAKHDSPNMAAPQRDALLGAIDAYVPLYFYRRNWTRPEDRDTSYLFFPDAVQTFKWKVWLALRRKALGAEELARRDAQREWMRETIRRNEDDAPRLIPQQLRALEALFADALSPLFVEPMTDAEFDAFKASVAKGIDFARRNPPILGIEVPGVDVVGILIGGEISRRYSKYDAIETPFADRVTCVGWGNTGYMTLSFASNVAFTGTGGSLLPQTGRTLRIPFSQEELREWCVAPEAWRVGTPVLRHLPGGDGESKVEGLKALKGMKLARLDATDWIAADAVSDEALRDLIAKRGTDFIPLAADRGGREVGSPRVFIGLLSDKNILSVLQVSYFHVGGVEMRARVRAPDGPGGANAAAEALAEKRKPEVRGNVRVHGTLVTESGRPVPGGSVSLYRVGKVDGKAVRFSVETDDKGAFEFKDALPGQYALSANGPELNVANGQFRHDHRAMDLDVTGEQPDVDLRVRLLTWQTKVRVTLVDPAGKPVRDASAVGNVFERYSATGSVNWKTDKDGVFELSGFPQQSRTVTLVVPARQLWARFSFKPEEDAKTLDVTVKCELGGTVVGRVVEKDTHYDVGGVCVRPKGPGLPAHVTYPTLEDPVVEGGVEYCCVTRDSDGMFRIMLPAGDYVLGDLSEPANGRAWAGRHGTPLAEDVRFTIRPGETTGTVMVRVGAFDRRGMLRGRVADAQGQPVRRQRIVITSGDPWTFLYFQRRAVTDGAGEFTVYPLGPGRYDFRVAIEGGNPGPTVPVEVTSDTVTPGTFRLAEEKPTPAAPAPLAEADPPGTWGEPVDGLRARITPAAATFDQYGPVTLTVEIENVEHRARPFDDQALIKMFRGVRPDGKPLGYVHTPYQTMSMGVPKLGYQEVKKFTLVLSGEYDTSIPGEYRVQFRGPDSNVAVFKVTRHDAAKPLPPVAEALPEGLVDAVESVLPAGWKLWGATSNQGTKAGLDKPRVVEVRYDKPLGTDDFLRLGAERLNYRIYLYDLRCKDLDRVPAKDAKLRLLGETAWFRAFAEGWPHPDLGWKDPDGDVRRVLKLTLPDGGWREVAELPAGIVAAAEKSGAEHLKGPTFRDVKPRLYRHDDGRSRVCWIRKDPNRTWVYYAFEDRDAEGRLVGGKVDMFPSAAADPDPAMIPGWDRPVVPPSSAPTPAPAAAAKAEVEAVAKAEVEAAAKAFMTAIRDADLETMKKWGAEYKPAASESPHIFFRWSAQQWPKMIADLRKVYEKEPDRLTRITETILQDDFAAVRLAPPADGVKKSPFLVLQHLPGGWRARWMDDIDENEALKTYLDKSASALRFNAAAGAPWGAEVDGVKARLVADKLVWKAGEVPTFKAEVWNNGKRDLFMFLSPRSFRLDFDSARFAAIGYDPRAKSSPFGAGRSYKDIAIALDRTWRGSKDGLVELTPGKHTVRVELDATTGENDDGKRFRAESNPVEIEILPAEAEKPQDAAWGDAVEGVQVRLRVDKVQWKTGETPTVRVEVRNEGKLEIFPEM